MVAWLLVLLSTIAPHAPMTIRMGSIDGCDRSLTDTFEVSPGGRTVWRSPYQATLILQLTPDDLDRLAHLERFDATRELPRDPERRYSRVWFVVESGAASMRVRTDSARARAIADVLFGAFERL